ncbi:MAG: hypothetical protein IPP40_18000 [bacterium]|nr:hypothetical protein [bacterium]
MCLLHARNVEVDMQAGQSRVFSVGPSRNDTLTLKAASMAASVADHILSFPKAEKFYNSVAERETGSGFCKDILNRLDLKIQVSDEDLSRVPTSGASVVVANHPFGLLDPMILYVTLRAIRPDVKVLTNFMLSRLRELHDFCIFVDPFGGPQAAKQNAKAVRETMEWLRDGGMVVMFPAEVADDAIGRDGWSRGAVCGRARCAGLLRDELSGVSFGGIGASKIADSTLAT